MSDLFATPLHEMNPLARFSDRATHYARYRPSYPKAAIAAVVDGISSATQPTAADIGAGTGISARLLAERGWQVWAIEPNREMQHAAEPHPQVTFQTGTAEATGLPDASVELVTCFQSFHWFNPDISLPEFHRILKPTGRLALVWNSRDRSDPLTEAYTQVVQHISGQHPAERRLVSETPLFTSAHFNNVQSFTFAYQQSLDFPGLLGRAQSVSYIPTDAASQQQLRDELQTIFDRWSDDRGVVQLTYETRVFLAEPTL